MYEFFILLAVNYRRRLCDWCIIGSHYMCTGVECYGCCDEYHDRKPGRGRGRGVLETV